MIVECPGTNYRTQVSDAAATAEFEFIGEMLQRYCPRCEEHHQMRVVAR